MCDGAGGVEVKLMGQAEKSSGGERSSSALEVVDIALRMTFSCFLMDILSSQP